MRILLCLVFVLCIPLGAEIVQIGSGTLINQSLPLEAFNLHSYSQQLYLASEIGSGGMIHSISFQYSIVSTAFFEANRELIIWFGHTERSFINSWIPQDSLFIVYNGQLQIADFSSPLPGQGWLTIILPQAFSYDGTRNLIIAVHENSPGSASNADEFYCSGSPLTRGIVWRGSTNVVPGNIPPTGVYLRQAFPNLRLNINIVNFTPHQPLPANNAFNVPTDTGFSWQSDCASFDLWFGSHPDSLSCLVQNHQGHSWNLPEPLMLLRNYFWRVVGHAGGESYPSPLWSFTTVGEALGAPQNLSAYYNGSQVRLSWSAPTTGTVVNYRVLRNGVQIGESTSTLYFDAAVTGGNTYIYQVKAVNHLGQVSAPSNTASVTIPSEIPNLILSEGFEQCESFSASIPGWQNLDLDGSLTWQWDNIDFPNEGSTTGWITFSPSQTVPPLTYSPPHGGLQMLMAMSALSPPNNDWLISRRLYLGNNPMLKFWARSYTADFGLERLKVLISTSSPTPQSFSTLNTGVYISVPTQWTEYSFNLSAWQNQSVHLAWQSVSWDAFALFLDDIQITGEGGYVSISDELAPSVLPKIYPNPSRGGFSIKHPQLFDLAIYDLRGRLIFKSANLMDFNSLEHDMKLSSGIYPVLIRSGNTSAIQKLVILK
ncbi:MAG: choice-of-anchor J domain-containing protein [Candidatus Cloacimonadaceae bacterium]|nr:choice-of-anchor J domain-containing protein [Candidatus Cloacimonadaceae bacterium]